MTSTRRSILKIFAGTPLGLLISGRSPAIAMTLQLQPDDRDPFDIDCRSYHMERTEHHDATGIWEKTFLKVWAENQHPSAGVNHGIPTVWFLRGDRDDPEAYRTGWLFDEGTPYRPTTLAEERIAAAVVQWLGTSCGMGFLGGSTTSLFADALGDQGGGR